ncbi:MAG: acetyl-CoA carboxylase carboxyltransferase subunit alpha [Trueperaceae bacterium]|nr:acetyl-CoA carboxylase carboxyltransferase subunit alpha [Trueperaceae bacterium]
MALPFEKPIADLEAKIREMQAYADEQQVDLTEEISLLQQRLERLTRETFAHLTRWQRVLVARAPGRPTALDHVAAFVDGFVELHGDRALGDDPALVAGLGRVDGAGVVVLAQQKGRDTKENIHRNFGMAHPSGYRKAMRMMEMADKFGLAVVALIDTPGAYPGIAAEEQGQAWVIAESIRRMSRLRVPAVAVVVGEGGSGGALAIGVANRVLILENAVYSVISPESCAAIRWRDAAEAPRAAEALKLTSADLLEQGVVDEVVAEPLGGAHKDPAAAVAATAAAVRAALAGLRGLGGDEIVRSRAERFRHMGRMLVDSA